jgi:phage terminase large subunit-like protein
MYHADASGWRGVILQGERSYDLMPWSQGEAGARYLSEARKSERPTSYARLFQNLWVSPTDAFIDPEAWDALVHPDYAIPGPHQLREPLYVGVDLAVKSDTSAVVSVFEHRGVLHLGPYRIWRPYTRQGVNLQAVEDYLLWLQANYYLAQVSCDPYQAQHLMQRLRGRMAIGEWPQTVQNMTLAGNTLFTLISEGNLVVPPQCADIREHVLNAQARNTDRGIRLVKGVSTRKIDAAIALAMAVASLRPSAAFAVIVAEY